MIYLGGAPRIRVRKLSERVNIETQKASEPL